MKAIVMEAPGSSDDFVEKDLDTPEINADELLIEVHATALNPVDVSFRTGDIEMENGFPAILSVDIAGVVAEVEADVTQFEEGDAVFTSKYLGTSGGFAEYVSASADLVASKPEAASFEEAAAMGLAPLTAYQLVNNEPHPLQADETVLIQGASGGVGTFAIQFAKHNGAKVIGTTSRNEDLIDSLGVDQVVKYKEQDVPNEFEEAADLLIDTAGQGTETLPVVREGGHALSIVSPFDDEEMAKRNVTAEQYSYDVDPDQFKIFAEQFANEELTVIIDEVFPFSEEGIKDAHDLIESGHAAGKVIVKVK